jgi:hypothetical protein
MKSISEFCKTHSACKDGLEGALENCQTMQQAWETLPNDWLVWTATREGVLTDKELRLFAVFCARQVEHLLTDDRSRNAITVAEKFANGEATKEELAAAGAAAGLAWAAAARAAAWDAAGAAGAAGAAAGAAWAAAGVAAWAAARVAARDAAWAAAWAAARAAAGDAQSSWLRNNTNPNFN